MTPALLLLAIIGFALELAVLWLMIRRKLRSQFPAFFYYVAVNALAAILFQVVGRWFPREYGPVYWAATAVSMLVSFWIFYEVFIAILKPHEALIDLGKLLFRWALVFLFIGAAVIAIFTVGPGYTKLCNVILVLEHCIQLMQCGVLLLLVAFESRLGLSWRSYAVAIGLGVGIFAAWDLSVTYLGGRVPQQQHLLDVLNAFVSIGSYSYWAAIMAFPEPARKNVLESPARLIFQRWNEALLASPLVAHNQVSLPVESFLPGVERAVERVMSRKMAN